MTGCGSVAERGGDAGPSCEEAGAADGLVFVACGNGCVRLAWDPDNCGSCGNRCGIDETFHDGRQKECSEGLCCDYFQINCGGQCVDYGTHEHCDGCDPCAPDEVCEQYIRGELGYLWCAPPCAAGWMRCPEVDFPGGILPECINTQIDEGHCGKCGNWCAMGEVCTAGKCGPPRHDAL